MYEVTQDGNRFYASHTLDAEKEVAWIWEAPFSIKDFELEKAKDARKYFEIFCKTFQIPFTFT